MSWTDERVEQLRQAWLEGKSASTIANLLGDGLTRNAVIGKVHRLGLAGRAKSPTASASASASASSSASAATAPRRAPAPLSARPAAHARPVATAASASARMVRGATALAIQSHSMTAAQPCEAPESVVLPMSVRVTIVDLKESMCRWPLGDPTSPEFRYCGSPSHSGPYCSHHGGLAYQPSDARRRERDRRLALR